VLLYVISIGYSNERKKMEPNMREKTSLVLYNEKNGKEKITQKYAPSRKEEA
jgi:hypothetical protein